MRRSGLLSVSLILFAASAAAGSSFTLEGFGAGIDVDDGFPNIVSNSFSTIQNPSLLMSPFTHQHSVTLPSSPNSTASASYMFVWN